jgi:hypothetical protein
VSAQESAQLLLIPFCPGVVITGLVMENISVVNAVIGLEEEFDVEGGDVLARDGRLG